jgi:hypothetical protein
MCATESWPANPTRARELLGFRGVEVHETTEGGGRLPFPDETFDLVTARRPVSPQWGEIHRASRPAGSTSLCMSGGPLPSSSSSSSAVHCPNTGRPGTPNREARAAEKAGLTVTDLRTARCRMEFFDIGAVVYLLRKCV